MFSCVDMQAGYREFLGAVASSEVVFREEVWIRSVGDDSLKHMEAFADALYRSGHTFRKLNLYSRNVSAIPFAKSVSSVLLGHDVFQDLNFEFHSWNEKVGKEMAAKFMTIIATPHIFRILKSCTFYWSFLDNEGMEQLMKPFNSLDNVLEELDFDHVFSNEQLEHVSGFLATSTSLKLLDLRASYEGKRNECTKGYTSVGVALCSNQSLQVLRCRISNSKELKALLDPLMPKPNNLQPNTTLTHLELRGAVGGKEGIETLVDMLRTNTSLLDLDLWELDELCSEDAGAIENVLAILEALKTNKSLKRFGFYLCSAVGGYEVLGAMMDLLLENNCIENIGLSGTGLVASGDSEYIDSALSKRKKMKLWGIVQGMANVKPTSGRVFLCGQPFAGKTRLRLSMKKLKESQRKDEAQNTSKIANKM